MRKGTEPRHGHQVAITRGDLAQLLYPIRVDMARIARQIEDIGRQLRCAGTRRNERAVPLPKPRTQR
jgi:hypothetical protein